MERAAEENSLFPCPLWPQQEIPHCLKKEPAGSEEVC